jgi:hypothetical protein
MKKLIPLAIFLLSLPLAYAAETSLVDALRNPETRGEAQENAATHGPKAIASVAALLDDADPAVQRSAMIALEKIVGTATAGEQSQRAASAALGEALTAAENKLWLCWLLSYCGGSEAMEPTLSLLSTDDFERGRFALERMGDSALRRSDTAMTKSLRNALTALAKEAEGPRRAMFLTTLGRIDDGGAEAFLLEELAGAESAAAANALGRVGGAASVDALWERCTESGDSAMVDAFLQVIASLDAERAYPLYQQFLVALRGTDTAARTRRCAALLGIGRTCPNKKGVDDLVPYLGAEFADVQGAAQAALTLLKAPGVNKKLRSLSEKEDGPVKATLLDVLAARDPMGSRKLFEACLEDEAETVRETAYRLVGRFGDPAMMETMLKAAKEETETVRPAALQGYLGLAGRALLVEDRDSALAMYHTALPLADQDNERLEILQGLTVLAHPSTVPFLEDLDSFPALARQLNACRLAIADWNGEADAALAEGLYRAVALHTTDHIQAARAEKALRTMGIQDNLPRLAGFVLRWKIIGPFTLDKFATVYPPEQEYRKSATYPGAGGAEVAWRPWECADILGNTDLRPLMNPHDQVVAYARAEIYVKQTQDVLLKLGSDDGVMVWLNGKKTHENRVWRRVTADEDVVQATLQAGTNVVLMKIIQGGTTFGYCMRITDLDGAPLAFTN